MSRFILDDMVVSSLVEESNIGVILRARHRTFFPAVLGHRWMCALEGFEEFLEIQPFM